MHQGLLPQPLQPCRKAARLRPPFFPAPGAAYRSPASGISATALSLFCGGFAMSHYGVLKDYRFPVAAEDIRGATLYGNDDHDKLGKIDDVIFDHATGQINYAIVDTGGWLSSKKFIVPADRLRASVKHDDAFTANLTKKQVESFPEYKESDLE